MKSLYFIILINLISASQFISNEASIPDQKNKLIFIYNASNDYLSVAFDFTHKIVSPKTYQKQAPTATGPCPSNAVDKCCRNHGLTSRKVSGKYVLWLIYFCMFSVFCLKF